MKKVLFAVLSFAFALSFANKAAAQDVAAADSCRKYMSYYTEYYKQGNIKDATPNWRLAYKYCTPGYRQSLYVDGVNLMRKLISKNAANSAYRQELIDTMMTLYNTRIQYFPAYAVAANNYKGLDMVLYVKDSETLFNGLEEIIGVNQEKTKPSLLFNDLNTAITLYQAGSLDAEKVIAAYQRNIALISSMTPAKDVTQESIDKTKGDMESIFITSKVASCDNLIALFTPRFEADPNNLELASNILNMMSNTEDCIANDLYLRATTLLYNNEPSARSAYALYLLNTKLENLADAEKYLEEAVKLSANEDPKTAATYNIQYATFCLKNGHTSKAYAAAQKTIDLDPDLAGKAYYIMGTIWGSMVCGKEDIERRAPYWVAVDYLQKARNADPSIADDCNRLIAQYKVYFPPLTDAFMYDLTDGMTYNVSCGGMHAVTTVRTQH